MRLQRRWRKTGVRGTPTRRPHADWLRRYLSHDDAPPTTRHEVEAISGQAAVRGELHRQPPIVADSWRARKSRRAGWRRELSRPVARMSGRAHARSRACPVVRMPGRARNLADVPASRPERDVGLVQGSARVHQDRQCEPGMLAIELDRRRPDPVTRAGRRRDDPARPGSGHPQLPGQEALVQRPGRFKCGEGAGVASVDDRDQGRDHTGQRRIRGRGDRERQRLHPRVRVQGSA